MKEKAVLEFTGSRLDCAICWAVKCHSGQVDKAGQPQILHPLRVMNSLRGRSENVLIVAVLHDVVEDSPMTVEHVRENFGAEVADAIDALTRREGEVYAEYIERVKLNEIGRTVKIVDLGDNLSRIEELPPEQRTIRKRYEKALKVLR